MRKVFSPHQKAQAAIEVIKEINTTNQIASQHEAHPTQIGLWKKLLLTNAHTLFADKRNPENREKDELIERLYKISGQRDTELYWLKKKCALNHEKRIACIDRGHSEIIVTRQAALLDISRASVYHSPIINAGMPSRRLRLCAHRQRSDTPIAWRDGTGGGVSKKAHTYKRSQ